MTPSRGRRVALSLAVTIHTLERPLTPWLNAAAVGRKMSCKENVAGKIQLRKSHQYYYQIQTQAFVCNADYCDFVIWTEEGLHDWVEPDHALWDEICERATGFFKRARYLNLLGNIFLKFSQQHQQLPRDHPRLLMNTKGKVILSRAAQVHLQKNVCLIIILSFCRMSDKGGNKSHFTF